MKSRKAPRYFVETSFPGTAFIQQGITKHQQLKTIGEGGMGFFASSRDARLLQLPQVDVSFIHDTKKIEVKARVEYCKALPEIGPSVFYLGLSYKDPSDEFIHFVRQALDQALTQGYLKPL